MGALAQHVEGIADYLESPRGASLQPNTPRGVDVTSVSPRTLGSRATLESSRMRLLSVEELSNVPSKDLCFIVKQYRSN